MTALYMAGMQWPEVPDCRRSNVVIPLGAEIRARREAKGLSRRSVAILANLDEKSVKNLEYGRRVNLETAALIAEVLGLRLTLERAG